VSERVRFRDLSQPARSCRRRSSASSARGAPSAVRGPALFLALLLAPPPAGAARRAPGRGTGLGPHLVDHRGRADPRGLRARSGARGPARCRNRVGDVRPVRRSVVFLFLGGFVLAEAMFATGLDRRFAYAILARQWSDRRRRGSSPPSRWRRRRSRRGSPTPPRRRCSTRSRSPCWPRSPAYSSAPPGAGRRDAPALRDVADADDRLGSSIGGIVTPVGTPPNLVVLGQLDQLAGVRVSFFQWMLVGAPVAR